MKQIDGHVHKGQTCYHPASGWLASRDPAAGLFSGLPLRAPSTSPGSGPESTCAQPWLFSLSPSRALLLASRQMVLSLSLGGPEAQLLTSSCAKEVWCHHVLVVWPHMRPCPSLGLKQ